MNQKISLEVSNKTVFQILFFLLGIFLIYVLRDIVILFIFAFILQAGFNPVIDRLEEKRIPRALSVIAIFLLVLAFLALTLVLIVPPLTGQVQNLLHDLPLYLNRFLEIFIPKDYTLAISQHIKDLIEPNQLVSVGGRIVPAAFGFLGNIIGIVTLLVLTFYLLLEKKAFDELLKTYLSPEAETKTAAILRKVSKKMSLWLRGQFLLSGLMGTLSFIGLLIIGVEYALTLAFFTAIMEFIPIIGPFLAAFSAAIIALGQSPIKAFWVLIFYVIIQQLESNILVPQVMKKTIGLNPVIIILAILIGAKLLGILGILLAVPFASATAVIVKELTKQTMEKEV